MRLTRHQAAHDGGDPLRYWTLPLRYAPPCRIQGLDQHFEARYQRPN